MSETIKVLVVDDSAFMRKMVSQILSNENGISVIGTARDGWDALNQIPTLQPDVITLDIEMPNLDGISTLKKVMEIRPTPVVMVSSLTHAGAEITLQCLDLGAVDFVAKPSGAISLDIEKVGPDIISKVRAAAGVRLRRTASIVSKPIDSTEAQPTVERHGPAISHTPTDHKTGILFIGTSTGGPKALQTLVPALPANLGVPVVIVQHMPPTFTTTLANRLDKLSKIEVREAKEGDTLVPNVALVAPGGFHMEINQAHRVTLTTEPPIHGVRPAIDVTLASLTKHFGNQVMAALLTGMGKDGARGLKNLRDIGGFTIAEHESTCVIYGMPRAAVDLDGVDRVLPLPDIAHFIGQHLRRSTAMRTLSDRRAA